MTRRGMADVFDGLTKALLFIAALEAGEAMPVSEYQDFGKHLPDFVIRIQSSDLTLFAVTVNITVSLHWNNAGD